jgi:choline dehydrogenase-like flavoprotein
LILEAGGPNDDKNLRVDGQRWLTFQNKDMNWGYKTVPQEHAANREIDYSRGKGLGGSSAINFGVFTAGARGDYDEWARIVDDDSFDWEHAQARLRQLETFHTETPAGLDASKYVAPNPENHGSSGPLDVGFADEWESDLLPAIDLFEKAGHPLNSDHNSGNPIGASVLISSAHKGVRSTAADLLKKLPDNVTIKTNSTVQRVILEGKKAVGVEVDGVRYMASKEVILSAGSLDTPRILMHSGIGPAEQLAKHRISTILDAPALGQGLRDHAFTLIAYKRTPESGSGRSSFYGDKNQALQNAALEQWKIDGTGPWAKYACELGVGYFKLNESFTSSPEFLALPATEQAYLNHETVPHYEVLTHLPLQWFIPDFPDEDLDYASFLVFLYNSQAKGTVELQSADPSVPLLFDPKFLEHEFDRRAAIDSLREVLRLAESPEFSKDTVGTITAPAPNATDEELLAYWQQTIASSWHMTGTAKMGKPGAKDAVVDKDFRVFDIEGLRIADMSVVPVLASCHTQSVACK